MDIKLEKINTNPKTLEEATEVIGKLVKVIIIQKKEINPLRERLNNNSNNSSLPPSHDLKKKKKENKNSGRKQGAQPVIKDHKDVLCPLRKLIVSFTVNHQKNMTAVELFFLEIRYTYKYLTSHWRNMKLRNMAL